MTRRGVGTAIDIVEFLILLFLEDFFKFCMLLKKSELYLVSQSEEKERA